MANTRLKDHPENTDEGKQAKAAAEAADQPTASQVQAKRDAELSQGFVGVEVDPTPNENYTVAGVTSGAPTPETDPDHRADVQRQLRN